MRRLLPLVALSLAACTGSQLQPAGPACTADQQCDPGDVCTDHVCAPLPDAGSSGPDAGAPDAGAADAGAADGGDLPDGGATPGHLTLSPSTDSLSVQSGTQTLPRILALENAGGSALHFALSCTQGTPSPASGALAAGTNTTVSLALPLWPSTGTQLATCTATATGADDGPLTYSLTATVTAAPQGVGPTGGNVDLLDFVMTGDTRPGFCNLTSSYPQAAFQQEVVQMGKLNPQFALDLGDHMFVCTNDLSVSTGQMKLYTDALTSAQFKPAWFMTMGNHECNGTDCSGSAASTDNNFVAYSAALKAVSQQSLPYYKVDVQTRLGLMRLVMLADNYADQTAQDWAETTLAEADRIAKYTIVARHHPVTGSRSGPQWSWSVIQKHKYSLILTAHNHSYSHDAATLGGRSVICGLGAANSSHTGFCRVQQQADGTLSFTQYDLSGNPGDHWSVGPQ